MKLIAKFRLENIYRSKDFKDKETGEVRAGKWKVQTFDKVEGDEGVRMKLIDISIPDSLAEKLQDKIGQEVSIPVDVYKVGNKIGFYGLEE